MKLKLVITFLISCILLGCSHKDVVFHDDRNNTIKLSDLKGKWIVINYWADWCDSCVAEIPQLNNFYKNNKDSKVLLFGVNYDHLPADKLVKSIKKRHIDYPNLVEDPGEIFQLGFLEVIPTTFIVNPKGDVATVISGSTTERQLLKILRDLQK
jgi:thiol-disulfide isomerase/thioredoxin